MICSISHHTYNYKGYKNKDMNVINQEKQRVLLQEKVPTISTLNNLAWIIYCIQLSELVQQVQNKLHYDTCIFFRPTGSSIKTFNLYDQAYTPLSLPTHFQVILCFLNLNVHYVKSVCQSYLSKSNFHVLKVQVIMAVKLKM